MKTNLLLSLIAATTLLTTSCKKNNNNGTAGVKYQLQTTNRSAVIARTTTGNLSWTSGSAYATEVKFEAKKDSKEVEFKSQSPQLIDLFVPLVTLGTITLDPGTYSEVEFEVELTPSGSNSALELNGQYTSGTVTTPVKFTVISPLELKNEKNNVVVTDNNSYKALTTLNLSLITKGVTEAMLNSAVRTSGTILISSTSNANIYNIILANLHDSDEVEFDHD
jgi:hypothetical protein